MSAIADGGPTDALTTVADLPAGWVTILGFVDSDANAQETGGDPDSGDPVTLPPQNEFEVLADTETSVTVYFGLLYP